MDDIQKKWELPSIAHFVGCFYQAFGLPELHVEELENAFLTSCTAEGSDLLNQLLAALLAGYYNSKNIEYYNYGSSLRDCLHQKWTVEGKRANPLTNAEFRSLSLVEKVDVVHSLCMFRLDADDVAEAVKSLPGEEMRIEPVGHDAEGSSYWNFNDERLYKEGAPVEEPKHKKKKKHKEKHKKKKGKHREVEPETDSGDERPPQLGKWELVCSTEEEWQDFVKVLKNSHHKQDKKLRKIILNDFIPLIADIIVEKEKAMKKRLLEMLPKRESDRLARKRAEINEQNGLMAKLEAEEREEERQLELEKKKMYEQRRKEELAKEREERNRAREEEKRAKEQAQQDRAMRALMREHKLVSGAFNSAEDNSMTDESSEETDWEQYNNTAGGSLLSSSSRQQHNRKSRQNRTGNGRHRNKAFGPKEYEKLNRILYLLQKDYKNIWPFLEPVTREIAPDYFDVIEKPMDIAAIRRKTKGSEYRSKEQFVEDFNLIVENCNRYNGPNSEKSFPADGGARGPGRRRQRQSQSDDLVHADETSQESTADDCVTRVSYTEQLTDSDSESAAESGTSSESSYGGAGRPRKTSHPPRRPARPKGSNNAKNRKAMNSRISKKQSVATESSSAESSSLEEEADEGGANLYKFVMSHNPPPVSKSLTMSQSHQILTDMPLPSSSGSATNGLGRMFGIARRTTNTTGNSGNNQPMEATVNNNSTTPHAAADTRLSQPAAASSDEVLSSPTLARVDKKVELARWMGKSPDNTPPRTSDSSITNLASHTGIVNGRGGGGENTIKIQLITKPTTVLASQQPFQGLVAQLKRNSVDTPPTGPPFKRPLA